MPQMAPTTWALFQVTLTISLTLSFPLMVSILSMGSPSWSVFSSSVWQW